MSAETKSKGFLAELTPAQVIQKVIDHYTKDPRFGINSNGGCLYKTYDGAKCAAGCLLPEDGPDLSKYVSSWGCAILTFPELYGPHNDLIAQLQASHDTNAQIGMNSFLNHLKNLKLREQMQA